MRISFFALLIGLLFTISAKSEELGPGVGVFQFSQWDGPSIPVYYIVPEKVTANTPVFFVMHGARRDGDRYQEEWLEAAQDLGAIALFPTFSKKDFPGREGYVLGNVIDKKGKPVEKAQWAFSAIEPLFDYVRASLKLTTKTYALYGHSGGSQFAHRFIYFVPDARAHVVIAANAGWYTMPDRRVDFPFGLNGISLSDGDLKKALERRVLIMLGNRDIDANHRSLNKSAQARKQGPHRFARGHVFYLMAAGQAARLGASFNWSQSVVPGAHHSNALMLEAAKPFLFGSNRNITAVK